MDDQSSGTRPAAPLTEEALVRSIRVIRIAIFGGVLAIAGATIAFLQIADAPAVPLLPLAATVVVVDIAFLVIFTRQRNKALADIRRSEGRVV
ncbi:MAG: hypothetical protein JJE23_05085 [Thermoleophilia bacterium]|jgi:hypothetical protein|nr:hypothetical protein [Thermoleophilia bacterium]